MNEKRKTYSYRLKDDVNKKIEYLTQCLNMNKGDVIEFAIDKIFDNLKYQKSVDEFKGELDEMKARFDEMDKNIKIIRKYHVLDTLKSSDYSNIKNVPSLTLKFDEDGRYGNKGDYVVKIEDVDKLTEYLSKTTNYYDEALSKLIKNNAQVEKVKK